MTPQERLYQHAWPAFKSLAIKALGRLGAAKLMREAADVLEAEQGIADQRELLTAAAAPNVVNLMDAAALVRGR